jgi:hypothetical protein
MIGGPGGFPFRAASQGGQPVVGFRCSVGAWAGKQALADLQPLFDRAGPATAASQAVAKDGYVVGGLELDASELVHAVRVIFVRRKGDGSLDRSDSYSSGWLGRPAGNSPQKLDSGTAVVIGVHGRKGAVIDAVGLVLGDR